MKLTTKYVAFDVHRATTVASVRDDSGRVLVRSALETHGPSSVEFLLRHLLIVRWKCLQILPVQSVDVAALADVEIAGAATRNAQSLPGWASPVLGQIHYLAHMVRIVGNLTVNGLQHGMALPTDGHGPL